MLVKVLDAGQRRSIVWVWAGVRKPPMHEPAGVGRCRYGDLGTGRWRRQPEDGRPLPLALDAERRGRAARAPVGRCPGARQADLVLASMAAEQAVGLEMQSPDSRSGVASPATAAIGRHLHHSSRHDSFERDTGRCSV